MLLIKVPNIAIKRARSCLSMLLALLSRGWGHRPYSRNTSVRDSVHLTLCSRARCDKTAANSDGNLAAAYVMTYSLEPCLRQSGGIIPMWRRRVCMAGRRGVGRPSKSNPTAKREFLSLIFDGVWLDGGRS